MKLPKWLLGATLMLIASPFVYLGLKLYVEQSGKYQLLMNSSDVSNFALIFTLAAIIMYVYYAYLLAKEAGTPSASLILSPLQEDPYFFISIIRNYSKISLNCWCNLNATVYGEAVSLGGFYSGESSFDIQPFGKPNGVLSIRDILSRVNRTVEEMREIAGSNNVKEQLYLNVEFWYSPTTDINLVVQNPRQPYYFDFTRNILVTDF